MLFLKLSCLTESCLFNSFQQYNNSSLLNPKPFAYNGFTTYTFPTV
nr:MAG TPA: hypothetical protein [Caudoviricetes sp.]